MKIYAFSLTMSKIKNLRNCTLKYPFFICIILTNRNIFVIILLMEVIRCPREIWIQV